MEELIETTSIRIRINKCSYDKYWYSDRIGEIMTVENIGVRDYYVNRNEGVLSSVLKIDAELLK